MNENFAYRSLLYRDSQHQIWGSQFSWFSPVSDHASPVDAFDLQGDSQSTMTRSAAIFGR